MAYHHRRLRQVQGDHREWTILLYRIAGTGWSGRLFRNGHPT